MHEAISGRGMASGLDRRAYLELKLLEIILITTNDLAND